MFLRESAETRNK